MDSLCTLCGKESSLELKKPSLSLSRTHYPQPVNDLYSFRLCEIFSFLWLSCFWFGFFVLLFLKKLHWCLQSMKNTRTKMAFSTWRTVERTHSDLPVDKLCLDSLILLDDLIVHWFFSFSSFCSDSSTLIMSFTSSELCFLTGFE